MMHARPSPQRVSQPPRRRVYGRRLGRPLSARRKRLLETLLPRLAVAPERRAPGFDPKTLFAGARGAGPVSEVWLEVGFGAGEHLAALAGTHPEVGFIGCEPYLNGVAALLARIDDAGLANIRVHADDARAVIERLADASISRVFVLFPDPWPKTRHAGRRFISSETLDGLARVMADGAELRVASDDAGYIRWALGAMTCHPAFAWRARGPRDWRARPADQPATRYETKARARGVAPVFLIFRRRARPDGGQKS